MPQLRTSTCLAALMTPLAGGAFAAGVDFDNLTPIVPLNDDQTTPNLITFDVSGITDVTDVDVTLFDLSHTWVGDLQISLEGPTGATATLLESPAALGQNLNFDGEDVTFSDGAPTLEGTFDETLAGGTFSPTSFTGTSGDPAVSLTTLNVFNGLDPTGTWTLSVFDDEGGDTGSLGGGARLSFTATEDMAAVPGPGALPLALGGVAAFGALAARRRRRKPTA